MKLITLRGEALLELTVGTDDDVRLAMNRMNETGRTLLLVVDDERLVGVLADGDIRRFLARGDSAEEPVTAAANRSPITVDAGTPTTDVRAFMARRGLEYLPLVDDGRIVALSILERAPRSSDLTAVIMSGGLGTRLAPLTDNCPKPLLPLGGKPILSHIIEHLQTQGVHHFVLSVNHLAHMIVDHYDDGSQWECFIDYVHESQRLGTGGALSLVDPETLSDPFLCLNGDVLNDVDIGALRDTHVTNGWDATMVVRQHSYTVPYGVVDVEDDGRFVQIREKPVTSLQINAGIYMLSKSTLGMVPRGQYYDLPSMFAALPSAGRSGGTYVHAGRWIDIGTASEYARAKAIFDDQEHS
jgi:dTDP-glucose pyrophosphorylase